jgi:hypothetical protein
MAISQRLVDPYREIQVPTSYSWQESYQAALLETDWTKMQERVQTAESEIHQRRLVLSQDHGGTDEERAALVNAMSGLRVLRMNAASWLERQNLGGTLCEVCGDYHAANSCVRKPVQNERSPYPVFDSPERVNEFETPAGIKLVSFFFCCRRRFGACQQV